MSGAAGRRTFDERRPDTLDDGASTVMDSLKLA
jgi:hypothetical protein